MANFPDHEILLAAERVDRDGNLRVSQYVSGKRAGQRGFQLACGEPCRLNRADVRERERTVGADGEFPGQFGLVEDGDLQHILRSHHVRGDLREARHGENTDHQRKAEHSARNSAHRSTEIRQCRAVHPRMQRLFHQTTSIAAIRL